MRHKKEYFSIREAAEYLGTSLSWIYQLVNSNRLAYVKVGSFYTIPAADLRAYKKANNKPKANR